MEADKSKKDLLYSKTTKGIRVSVETNALEEQSRPQEEMYAFAYRVTIENTSGNSVQLLRRHWIITSGGQPHSEVEGEGVVGDTPILKPSEIYSYQSGSVITDPFGSMEGEYLFQLENGDTFMAEIPRFDLIYPIMMH